MLAVYASTRNLYQYLPMTIGSLLRHNPDWRVLIYCEDDEIESLKDPRVSFVNVNGLKLFDGIKEENLSTHFGTFTLIRCFLPSLLPNESRILWLDVDTCITGCLSDLEELELRNKAIAAVMENNQPPRGIPEDFFGLYINSGVMLMNLDFIRQHSFDKKWLKLLATRKFRYPDQDAINLACKGFIYFLDVEYNYSPSTVVIEKPEPKIYHYTFNKIWNDPAVRLWRKNYIKDLKDKPELE